MTVATAYLKPKNGFSLVELSVVLVIIALLAGGIMAGQSMVRNAELQKIMADYGLYKQAINNFKEQYMQLPGDMYNATDIWGTAGGNNSNVACINNQDYDAIVTCNGNGDGEVFSSSANFTERFLAWKHLNNAGLIKGRFTGKSSGNAGTYEVNNDVTLPSGGLENSFWDLSALGDPAIWLTDPSWHALILYDGPTAKEVWQIDDKMDDGLPYTGDVITTKTSSSGTYYSANCAVSETITSKYNLTLNAIGCVLAMRAD